VRSNAAGNPWNRKNNNDNKYLNIFGGLETMVQLGKRYRCEECGTEILCTKAGEGITECCGKEMQVQEPKPLPSSD